MIKTNYKYINMVEIETEKPRKTTVWKVVNKFGICLGRISWYSVWRLYCLFPDDGIIFNTSCLENINDFINQLMDLRKKEKKK